MLKRMKTHLVIFPIAILLLCYFTLGMSSNEDSPNAYERCRLLGEKVNHIVVQGVPAIDPACNNYCKNMCSQFREYVNDLDVNINKYHECISSCRNGASYAGDVIRGGDPFSLSGIELKRVEPKNDAHNHPCKHGKSASYSVYSASDLGSDRRLCSDSINGKCVGRVSIKMLTDRGDNYLSLCPSQGRVLIPSKNEFFGSKLDSNTARALSTWHPSDKKFKGELTIAEGDEISIVYTTLVRSKDEYKEEDHFKQAKCSSIPYNYYQDELAVPLGLSDGEANFCVQSQVQGIKSPNNAGSKLAFCFKQQQPLKRYSSLMSSNNNLYTLDTSHMTRKVMDIENISRLNSGEVSFDLKARYFFLRYHTNTASNLSPPDFINPPTYRWRKDAALSSSSQYLYPDNQTYLTLFYNLFDNIELHDAGYIPDIPEMKSGAYDVNMDLSYPIFQYGGLLFDPYRAGLAKAFLSTDVFADLSQGWSTAPLLEAWNKPPLPIYDPSILIGYTDDFYQSNSPPSQRNLFFTPPELFSKYGLAASEDEDNPAGWHLYRTIGLLNSNQNAEPNMYVIRKNQVDTEWLDLLASRSHLDSTHYSVMPLDTNYLGGSHAGQFDSFDAGAASFCRFILHDTEGDLKSGQKIMKAIENYNNEYDYRPHITGEITHLYANRISYLDDLEDGDLSRITDYNSVHRLKNVIFDYNTPITEHDVNSRLSKYKPFAKGYTMAHREDAYVLSGWQKETLSRLEQIDTSGANQAHAPKDKLDYLRCTLIDGETEVVLEKSVVEEKCIANSTNAFDISYNIYSPDKLLGIPNCDNGHNSELMPNCFISSAAKPLEKHTSVDFIRNYCGAVKDYMSKEHDGLNVKLPANSIKFLPSNIHLKNRPDPDPNYGFIGINVGDHITSAMLYEWANALESNGLISDDSSWSAESDDLNYVPYQKFAIGNLQLHKNFTCPVDQTGGNYQELPGGVDQQILVRERDRFGGTFINKISGNRALNMQAEDKSNTAEWLGIPLYYQEKDWALKEAPDVCAGDFEVVLENASAEPNLLSFDTVTQIPCKQKTIHGVGTVKNVKSPTKMSFHTYDPKSLSLATEEHQSEVNAMGGGLFLIEKTRGCVVRDDLSLLQFALEKRRRETFGIPGELVPPEEEDWRNVTDYLGVDNILDIPYEEKYRDGKLLFRVKEPTSTDLNRFRRIIDAKEVTKSQMDGQYIIRTDIKYVKTPEISGVSFNGMIEHIMSILVGDSLQGGLLRSMQKSVFIDAQFALIIRAVLFGYLTFTALMFLIGMIQTNIKEVSMRLMKFVIVAVLISQNTWDVLFDSVVPTLFLFPLEMLNEVMVSADGVDMIRSTERYGVFDTLLAGVMRPIFSWGEGGIIYKIVIFAASAIYKIVVGVFMLGLLIASTLLAFSKSITALVKWLFGFVFKNSGFIAELVAFFIFFRAFLPLLLLFSVCIIILQFYTPSADAYMFFFTGILMLVFIILCISAILWVLYCVMMIAIRYVAMVFTLSLLILLAPIFILFMLFKFTTEMFQTWIKTILVLVLEPFLTGLSFMIFSQMIFQFMEANLSLPVCATEGWVSMIFGYAVFPVKLANIVTACIFLYMITNLMYALQSKLSATLTKVIVGAYIGADTQQLAQGVVGSSIKATSQVGKLTGGAVRAGYKIGGGNAKAEDKKSNEVSLEQGRGGDRGGSDRKDDRGSGDKGGDDRGGDDRGGDDRGGSDRGGSDRGGSDRGGSDRGNPPSTPSQR